MGRQTSKSLIEKKPRESGTRGSYELKQPWAKKRWGWNPVNREGKGVRTDKKTLRQRGAREGAGWLTGDLA